MPTRLWCCWMGASQNAARTMNCWRPAAITRTCITSSFWKKSWNALKRSQLKKIHEQSARRRGTRKGIRLAPDAAAVAVHGAVQVVGGARAGACGGGDAAGVSAADSFSQCHRPLLCACDEPLDRGKRGVDRYFDRFRDLLSCTGLRFPGAIRAN